MKSISMANINLDSLDKIKKEGYNLSIMKLKK